MSDTTIRKNALGLWWVIRCDNPDIYPIPIFWTGHLQQNNKLIFDPNIRLASQFYTADSAIFQAKILGIQGNDWEAVQFRWD